MPLLRRLVSPNPAPAAPRAAAGYAADPVLVMAPSGLAASPAGPDLRRGYHQADARPVKIATNRAISLEFAE
jgi:hypothetical protein